MKFKSLFLLAGIMSLICISQTVKADELDSGKQLMSSGNAQAAADILCRLKTPEALALCGRALDSLADYFTGVAEKKCYWGKGGGASPS